MTFPTTYPSTPARCAHRGEHYPLTTPLSPFSYLPSADAMVCAVCGAPARAAAGGLIHPDPAPAGRRD